MHSASHSVGGRGFSGRSFAGTRSFRSGSFAGRAGVGRFALGRSFGGLLGHSAAHTVAFGRPGAASHFAAGQAYRHGAYAWQGYHRGYVGWGGPVFWPYAYDDEFDYAFSPYGAYNGLFWSYGYDDLFAGILLPYAYAVLEGGNAPTQSYSAPAPSRVRRVRWRASAPIDVAIVRLGAIARRQRGDRSDRQGGPARCRPERQA